MQRFAIHVHVYFICVKKVIDQHFYNLKLSHKAQNSQKRGWKLSEKANGHLRVFEKCNALQVKRQWNVPQANVGKVFREYTYV